MEMPVFISHYTTNSPYEEHVKNLIASLEKHKLPYDVESINTLGSWRANSNYCAWQIQKMLKKHYPKPVLRLDADAVVQRYPSWFVETNIGDISTVIWPGFRKGGELLGGTMYFKNNERTVKVVNRWVKLCTKTPLRRNPDLLQQVIWEAIPFLAKKKLWPADMKEYIGDITFTKMPLAYCTIFDHMAREVPEPVIEHFQASRKCRKIMNRK